MLAQTGTSISGRCDSLMTFRHFKYVASQSRNVLYQNWLFCGFEIQCPSSGKTASFEGTSCLCYAEKNSRLCV